MFPNSQIATTENIECALSLLQCMKENMEHTNIFKALTIAFDSDADNDYPRNIFLLTDGGDEHSEESLQLIEKNKSACQIHGFEFNLLKRKQNFYLKFPNLAKDVLFLSIRLKNLEKVSLRHFPKT